jgi:hypothetical protein
LVDKANAFLRAEVRPADASLKVIEAGASAFEREAVQRRKCADGPEANPRFLGNERYGDTRELAGEDACGLDALPEAADSG